MYIFSLLSFIPGLHPAGPLQFMKGYHKWKITLNFKNLKLLEVKNTSIKKFALFHRTYNKFVDDISCKQYVSKTLFIIYQSSPVFEVLRYYNQNEMFLFTKLGMLQLFILNQSTVGMSNLSEFNLRHNTILLDVILRSILVCFDLRS